MGLDIGLGIDMGLYLDIEFDSGLGLVFCIDIGLKIDMKLDLDLGLKCACPTHIPRHYIYQQVIIGQSLGDCPIIT